MKDQRMKVSIICRVSLKLCLRFVLYHLCLWSPCFSRFYTCIVGFHRFDVHEKSEIIIKVQAMTISSHSNNVFWFILYIISIPKIFSKVLITRVQKQNFFNGIIHEKELTRITVSFLQWTCLRTNSVKQFVKFIKFENEVSTINSLKEHWSLPSFAKTLILVKQI